MVCHCRFCQRRLGTAFATIAYFEASAVEMLQGLLTTCEHRSDESGRWIRMEFCPKCGTTIGWAAEARPGFRGIAAGTLWSDVPMNWTCPECGARKEDFEMVQI